MEDLFGQVTEKPKRETSKADTEKLARVHYHRRSRNGPHVGCHDCIADGKGIAPAAYLRAEGDKQTALCFRHKQQRQDEERLEATNAEH